MPEKIDTVIKHSEDYLHSNAKLENVFTAVLDYGKNWLETDFSDYASKLASSFASGVLGAVNFIKNLAIGIICAIYLLLSKKLYLAKIRKLLYCMFNKENVQKIIRVCKRSHTVFSGFINGKLLDSLIIGVLCFIGVTALRMPYTVLISVIIGVTNVIPVFGPYIGAIPCALLLLLTEPVKGLYFVIFIILLQTLDGNILGPKILGQKIGLDTFWVVFAIVVGGGLFGIIGMVIGVPVFAVVYYAVKVLVNRRLSKKGLPVSLNEYKDKESEKTADA